MGESLRKFRVSNDALDEAEELRRRIADEGCLFFRGCRAGRLMALRRDRLEVIERGGWLMPGIHRRLLRSLQAESFHRSGHWSQVLDVVGKILDRQVLPHPRPSAI